MTDLVRYTKYDECCDCKKHFEFDKNTKLILILVNNHHFEIRFYCNCCFYLINDPNLGFHKILNIKIINSSTIGEFEHIKMKIEKRQT